MIVRCTHCDKCQTGLAYKDNYVGHKLYHYDDSKTGLTHYDGSQTRLTHKLCLFDPSKSTYGTHDDDGKTHKLLYCDVLYFYTVKLISY